MQTLDDQIRLVLDLLNTVDVTTGTDLLDDPAAYRAWAAHRSLAAGDLVECRSLRDALRRELTDRSPARTPPLALAVVPDPQGGLALAGSDLAGAVAAGVVTLTALGRWPRFKLCPAEDCREAFYDRSRNCSRVWCEMSSCGNIAKARRYRARARR